LGGSTASAIRNDSALFNWGAANSGQFADIWYVTINRSSPVQVGNTYAGQGTTYISLPYKVNNNSWTMVDAGNSFTSGINYQNKLYMWGLNTVGQLGQNDSINRSSPSQVGSNQYLSVSVGGSNTGVIGKLT
jgi:alpha-tubulin suppressor-like RCC1 family protein